MVTKGQGHNSKEPTVRSIDEMITQELKINFIKCSERKIIVRIVTTQVSNLACSELRSEG